MIRVECQQNTDEWLQARLGIPTASNFHRIVTPSGKASTQADAYCFQLLAEMMTGSPQNGYINAHMDRGHELEPEARGFYELQKDCAVEQVGFCLIDDKTAGASPDGLVGDEGLLEIKCPAPHTHVQYLLSRAVDKEYWPQIQGQLWVTGRAWIDILSYHPEMTPVIIRVGRDEAYIESLSRAVDAFVRCLNVRKGALVERGCRFAEVPCLP